LDDFVAEASALFEAGAVLIGTEADDGLSAAFSAGAAVDFVAEVLESLAVCASVDSGAINKEDDRTIARMRRVKATGDMK